MNDSPSVFARLRAGLAGAMAGLASGARRLEDWSSRGTRTILLTLIAVAMLAFGALGLMHESRAVSAWMRGDHHAERHDWGVAPKPDGKPHGEPGGFAGKPDGKPEGRPHAPPFLPPPPPPPPLSPAQP